MKIRWLNSYGHINDLALRKILKKFVKNFFEEKGEKTNVRNALTQIINAKTFKSTDDEMNDELKILSHDMLKFYADCFCKGNIHKASQALNRRQTEIRKTDLILMVFFGGMIIMLIPLAIFLILIPSQKDEEDLKDHWELLESGIEIYYFTLVLIVIIAATGYAVKVFREYEINYTFIFEIDEHYAMIHHQFYRLAIMFFFVWMFCLIWQILEIKLNILFSSDFPFFTVILILGFTGFCCFPFHVCYLKGRIEVAKTIWHILISPFGHVRFRHFFMADIITSMSHCLQDTAIISCYFASGKAKTGSPVEELREECLWLFRWKIFVSFLPYWWRFAQCLNKYYYTRNKNHILNAMKYSTSLGVAFASIWLVKSKDDSPLTKKEVNTGFWGFVAIKVV